MFLHDDQHEKTAGKPLCCCLKLMIEVSFDRKITQKGPGADLGSADSPFTALIEDEGLSCRSAFEREVMDINYSEEKMYQLMLCVCGATDGLKSCRFYGDTQLMLAELA